MPTIIDELVLRFSLDTAGVDAGQRRVLDSIRKLETGAKRGGEVVEQQGINVATFIRGLENPLGALRGHFEKLATATVAPKRGLGDLAAQARVTGKGVESSALEGAAGLRVLGAAGLAATAVISSLNKIIADTAVTQKSVFSAGIGAAGAGLPIRTFSAISQALYTKENVPEADTQAWLTQFTQAKERAAQNDFGPAIALNRQMQIAGINADVFTSTPEQAMVAIAQRFGQVSSATAIASGGLIGMSPTLATGLRGAGQTAGGLEPMIAAARARAITSEDRDLAKRRLDADNDLVTSMNVLQRKIADDLTPGIVGLDKTLKAIIDFFNAHGNLRGAAGDVALGAAGGPLGAALGGAVSLWNRIWGGAAPASSASPNWWQRTMPTWLGGRSNQSGSAAPLPTGGTPTATTGNWEVRHNNFAGIRRPGIIAGPESGGFMDYPTPEAGIQATSRLLQTYQTRHGLNTLRGIISRWAPPTDNNDTAGLIARASRVTGFGPDQPLNLSDPATMSAVVEAMIRGEEGGRLPRTASRQIINRALGVGGGTTNYLAWARRGGVSTANSNTSHTVHVGTINVHTRADTAAGVGAAALMAAKGADLVTQANTGYQ